MHGIQLAESKSEDLRLNFTPPSHANFANIFCQVAKESCGDQMALIYKLEH